MLVTPTDFAKVTDLGDVSAKFSSSSVLSSLLVLSICVGEAIEVISVTYPAVVVVVVVVSM